MKRKEEVPNENNAKEDEGMKVSKVRVGVYVGCSPMVGGTQLKGCFIIIGSVIGFWRLLGKPGSQNILARSCVL